MSKNEIKDALNDIIHDIEGAIVQLSSINKSGLLSSADQKSMEQVKDELFKIQSLYQDIELMK